MNGWTGRREEGDADEWIEEQLEGYRQRGREELVDGKMNGWMDEKKPFSMKGQITQWRIRGMDGHK